MNKIKLSGIAAGVLSLLSGAAFANEPPAGAHGTMPTMGEMLGASGIVAAGYIDASYDYVDGDGVFTSGVANRVFESEPSGFFLHQVGLTLAKQPAQGVGGLLNVTLGKDADLIAASGTGGGQYAGTDNFDVTQAFIQYATGNFTIMGGKFVTMSGAEVINSTANANASRSILFGYAIPFGHTGVRASFKFGDVFTLYAGLNNGWDQQSDLNKQKTGELCGVLTPTKSFTLAAAGYVGNEPVGGGVSGTRTLVDVVASFVVSDALTLVLNGDWAEQENFDGVGNTAEWSGVAGYANLKFNDTLTTSVRAEYFDDGDGFRTGVAQKWKEVTVTLNVAVADGLNVMPEIRFDSSDQDSFSDDSGASANDSQFGGMVKAIYKF